MLAHFQQALADLVASPQRCQRLRDGHDPAAVFAGYDLTARERARLVGIAGQEGMGANCTVYRSNRLTPIVLNLPGTCTALGAEFRAVADRFWATHPTEHFVHFLIESDRFATFLASIASDLPVDVAQRVADVLAVEAAAVRTRLAATLAVRQTQPS